MNLNYYVLLALSIIIGVIALLSYFKKNVTIPLILLSVIIAVYTLGLFPFTQPQAEIKEIYATSAIVNMSEDVKCGIYLGEDGTYDFGQCVVTGD